MHACMQSMGLDPLVMASLGVSNARMISMDTTTADYWPSRWHTYQYYYAFGRYVTHRTAPHHTALPCAASPFFLASPAS